MRSYLFFRWFKCIPLTMVLFLFSCKSMDNNKISTSNPIAEKLYYIDLTKTRFPLNNYPQDVGEWVLTTENNNDIPLMDQTSQKKHFTKLLSKYYGMGTRDKSPWNQNYITHILKNNPEKYRDASIRRSLSARSISWGENFRINSARWREEIRRNSIGTISTLYLASSRAITVRETRVRALPTEQPAYHDPKRAGEGYPFDYLQMSAIQPATPIYILTESQDKAWKYVISPAVTGWVKSEDVATVSASFVARWTALAIKNIGAVIQQSVSVQQGNQFYFLARPGTILPFEHHRSGYFSIFIPVRKADGSALLKSVSVHEKTFTAMPWPMTRTNIAILMKSMSGQPYGWGNSLSYNDCSSELRNLMIPFGILLPRNSAAQIKATARTVDLSNEPLQDRIAYLEKHGKPFTTLVYIPGHIMLYIGNGKFNGKSVPMTYQNLWALRPRNVESRSIVGSSVFFPLLDIYPERPEIISLADKKEFKLGFLETENSEL